MKKFKFLLFLLLFNISSNIYAGPVPSLNFLLPICMNPKYWVQVEEGISTVKEKFELTVENCQAAPGAVSACMAIPAFPANIACASAVIAACSGLISETSKTITITTDTTYRIIDNCIGLIPIAMLSIQVIGSGQADKALDCMLNIFGSAISIIPQLKDSSVPEAISEMKSLVNSVTNIVKDVVDIFKDTTNAIIKPLDWLINITEPIPPIPQVFKALRIVLNAVFAMVPLLVQIVELGPLLILANICNNYAPGMGGVVCTLIIKTTCFNSNDPSASTAMPGEPSSVNNMRQGRNKIKKATKDIDNANKKAQSKAQTADFEAKNMNTIIEVCKKVKQGMPISIEEQKFAKNCNTYINECNKNPVPYDMTAICNKLNPT